MMMMDALWHAALLAAHLWAASDAAGVVDALDGGTVLIGAMRSPKEVRVYADPGSAATLPNARKLVGKTVILEERSEYGPPILSDIPYVSRLFRNVGWSRREVPLLPPLKAGEKLESESPPCAEILQALPPLTCIKGVYEESRDDVDVTYEKLVDQVDPPRFFPLIGQAQLHRVHWKCTVNFTETIESTYPFAFRQQRRRSEVVYIDKDHVHLYVAEKDDAEAQEIRPLPMARPAKCAAVPQVQLDIVVATINRSARPKLTYPWADSTNDAVGIIADQKAAHAFLYKLRKDGVLDIVASPKLMTLSGQPAEFTSGQEAKVKTADGTISQHIGSRIQALAKVKADGKIVLEIRADVTTLNPANDVVVPGAAPISLPGFDVRSCQATFEMKDGQTLALRQVTKEEREAVERITLIDNNPFIGAFWMTIRKREGINEDTVILVTPHIVTPCCCEAEEQEQPDARVVACWENRAGSMVGSVYLFSEETKRTVEAAGRLEVQAFDMAPALRGEEPRLLAQWTFHPDMLEKLQRKDLIGVGYTLRAPWADLPANVENIKLQTVYVPAQGASRSDQPTYVARQSSDNDTLGAGQTQERRIKIVQVQAVSNQRTKEPPPVTGPTPLSVTEIVALSKAGVATGVILRQMEIAKGLTLVRNMIKADEYPTVLGQLKVLGFTLLTVDDLIEMTKQGVDEEVIRTMQDQSIAYLKQYYGN